MKHTGYEFLRSALLQSTAALKFGQHKEPQKNLFLFQDIFSDYILDALGTTQDIHYYCHPIIQKMLHRGDPWELTLIHTLGVYIQNGQNASSTAAKVFVHRNTLLNRLSAIEKIFDIHFDSLDEETLQILYFSCFIAEKLLKTTEPQNEQFL
jgi:sugar diacid utilization regulator